LIKSGIIALAHDVLFYLYVKIYAFLILLNDGYRTMKNIRNYLGAASLFALSLGAIGTAQSAIISQTYSFSVSSGVDLENPFFNTLSVTDIGTIDSLKVAVSILGTEGAKPFWGDLTMSLKRGSDTKTLIHATRSERQGVFDVVFDDAGVPIPSSPDNVDLTGSYQPVDALSFFNGSALFGDWTLNITDTFADNDRLKSWSLIVRYDDGVSAGIPEPAVLSLIGAGLLGMGFIRRRRSAKA